MNSSLGRSLKAGLLVPGLLTAGQTAGEAQDRVLPAIVLPAPQTDGGAPLMQALRRRHSTREFAHKPLQPQQLSNMLWAAFGINRPDTGGRTAPSAHNAQEISIYVVLPGASYRYDPAANKLVPVHTGDLRALTGTQPFPGEAPLNLVYVADLDKLGRDTDENRRFYAIADAGHISENVYLFCASEGLAVVVRGSIDRPALATALGLGPSQRVMLAQSVGYPK
ncbi:nitroreductase family protein [Massilia agilis]|uniref:Nitroreductase family protein n=1 Tax=Massilia agilis TaxID=1811226 RepID=A0ABT2DC68_9BURK|nr:nitroreductase family protein [Massilia agilis]MCS0808841.1 nitroreductase family protein [Massilia agilis]